MKRWFGLNDKSRFAASGGDPDLFRWIDPGQDNPFPIRLLDVRSLTWNLFATSSDVNIARSFNAQRNSSGHDLCDTIIDNATTIECHLVFPHNGDLLEGVVFKADTMEVKWDIYIYDSVFLFARSWTGQLQYRAFATIDPVEIIIHKIETRVGNVETAAQAVYFLIASHAMGRVFPHTIPRNIAKNEQEMAELSFSMLGNRACDATYEDITTIPVSKLTDGM